MDCAVHGFLQARILEWVAFPISRGSSQPRDWTQVSCIAGGFFTSWASSREYYKGASISLPSGGRFPFRRTSTRRLILSDWIAYLQGRRCDVSGGEVGRKNWANKPSLFLGSLYFRACCSGLPSAFLRGQENLCLKVKPCNPDWGLKPWSFSWDHTWSQCFPVVSDGKDSAWNAGDPGLIPGSGRSPGEGNGHPLQYPCLESSLDRGACPGPSPWSQSQTRLSD